jgi:hypothetical protein
MCPYITMASRRRPRKWSTATETRKWSTTTETLQGRDQVFCGQFVIVLEKRVDQVEYLNSRVDPRKVGSPRRGLTVC